MTTLVVARARLSLAVGLDKKTTKVRDELVDLLGLLLPPLSHRLVQRVSRLGLFQCHGCGEVDRQIHLDMVRAQDVGNLLHLLEIRSCQHLGRRIDIVQHCAIDTYRGIGTSIFLNQFRVESGNLTVLCLPKDALASIATLNTAVEVVPMVQQAQVVHGMCLHIGIATQQSIGTIQQTSLTTGRECTAIKTIAIIIGHGGIELQGDVLSLIIGFQLLFGNLNCWRLTVADNLCFIDRLIAQP